MREYGRHIQKMVEYLLSISDREKRQQQTYIVIELMGTLNPHLKNVEDFRHMLWDHLFFISDFKLDVESPYPIPQKETYKAKPEPIPYPKRHPKYSHLGKNIEMIIDKALTEENPDKKAGFANAIAYYMKLSYSNWHKEMVQDDAIRSELTAMTKGQLDFNNTPYVKYNPPAFESDEYRPARKVYAGRNNSNSRQNSNSSRGSYNTPGNRTNNNRSGGSNSNRNNNRSGSNFKKRFL